MIQGASDAGNTAGFVYFIFDLLHLDGEDVGVLPLIERKGAGCRFAVERWSPTALQRLSPRAGDGFPSKACASSLEGIVSKRADAAYARGNPGVWLKVKCLNGEEFVVVAGPTPKERGPISALCCSLITIPKGTWSMPAVPAPASSTGSWSGYGEGCNR
jgi:ATP-dependent DNA ligase